MIPVQEKESTISDEVRSIQEQITHYNTRVDRIYNTMELSYYFSSKPGSETEGATCYVPPSAVDPKSPPDAKESLDDLMDRLYLLNPGFSVIERVADVNTDENVKVREYQRPAGYSGNTRVHLGRLCMPVLNDSGATCACVTDESMVLLIILALLHI
mgnify:CR=1 FL=1